MPMILIREATVDDAPLLHRVMLQAFDEYRAVLNPPSSAYAETVADVAAAITAGGGLVACIESEVAGCARYAIRPTRLYVGRVSVLPGYRRRGVALALMTEMERIARGHHRDEIRSISVMRARERIARGHHRDEIEVAVRMSLPANVNLYRRLGYELVDVQPHPRGPDRTGTMVKRLTT